MGAIVYHTHSKETTPSALIYTKENINIGGKKTAWHTWQMTAKYDLLISICNQIDFTEELAPKWEVKLCCISLHGKHLSQLC